MKWLRLPLVLIGFVLLWEAIAALGNLPPYILPGPLRVVLAIGAHWERLVGHASVTMLEMALGLLLGTAFGAACALTLAYFRPARLWLLPVLVASQAVPVFALAPILVLWFGYGIASKVAMAALIIFFPVATAFFDGLRRTEAGWLDLAHTMGARRWRVLWHVRAPAALPALASGLRVAAAVAPIGAVVGEWVGSSAGLGYFMLQANGRMQIDLMFAALLVLAIIGLALYFALDAGLRRALPWVADSAPVKQGD
ncbi:MAG: ABC transporter permease [Alphaproteobacteria bacterium]|nr:ABC transporter permease [Alphaproteobacteria bacterium]